ncbi:hypothetical protein TNCV_3614871 [Trichonephila clavipes]|nr:hypothetical protein TNCV_3614871 [Trichonephila clavipes]
MEKVMELRFRLHIYAQDVGLPELIYGTKRNRFTAERYSVFAEEASQFAVSGRKVIMTKERRVDPLYPRDERRSFCRQKNKEKENIYFAGKSPR